MKDPIMEATLVEMAKQVGNVYHFTRQQNLESILDSGKLVSRSGHISVTRNYNLPHDFNQVKHNLDLSHTKGYNIRLTLDGNKISEHHKIKPLAGVTAELDDAHDTTKYRNSRVSRHEHEAEEAIHTKSLHVLPHIKHISILPNSEEGIKHAHEVLKPKLEKLGIPHHIGRKFHPYKTEETDMGYVSTKLNENFIIEF